MKKSQTYKILTLFCILIAILLNAFFKKLTRDINSYIPYKSGTIEYWKHTVNDINDFEAQIKKTGVEFDINVCLNYNEIFISHNSPCNIENLKLPTLKDYLLLHKENNGLWIDLKSNTREEILFFKEYFNKLITSYNENIYIELALKHVHLLSGINGSILARTDLQCNMTDIPKLMKLKKYKIQAITSNKNIDICPRLNLKHFIFGLSKRVILFDN